MSDDRPQQPPHPSSDRREIQGNDNHAVQGDGNIVNQGNGNQFINSIVNIVSPNREASATTMPQRDATAAKLLKYSQDEVKSRLEQSLHHHIFITLDLEDDPTQIVQPWAMQVKIGTQQPQLLPTETPVRAIYDRGDIHGRLLILGDPGSGKTTTLLQLAQVLVERAQGDVDQPIPVLFNLSSWTVDKQSIREWLLDSLKWIGMRRDIGEQYLDQGRFIPLLDGLDELAAERQESCVRAINQFLRPDSWQLPLVVCSRREEYQRLQSQLGLQGSVILQPLSGGQIRDYVERTGAGDLWQTLAAEPDLLDLARTPFFLTVMVLACEQLSFGRWRGLATTAERLDYLFEAYLQRILGTRWLNEIRYRAEQYPKKMPRKVKYYLDYAKEPERTLHWLGWLARTLKENNQTEFLIEKLQPFWLGNKQQRLIVGLIVGLIGGLGFGLGLGLIGRLSVGLSVGLSGGLSVGLSGGEIEIKRTPNQGIKASIYNTILVWGLVLLLGGGLVVGLWAISDWLNQIDKTIFSSLRLSLLTIVMSIPVTLDSGQPVLQHFSLRLVLTHYHYAPWNYARFLDYCRDRHLLQRVGGGYRFIHRLLQDYIARRYGSG